jgi:plastocyanin
MFPDGAEQSDWAPLSRRAVASGARRGRAWPLLCGVGMLLLILSSGVPARETAGGIIHGTVRITEKLTAQRMRFRLYPGARPALPSPDRERRNDEYRNIVIYLKSAEPVSLPEHSVTKVYSMAQEGETFVPHVLPIPVGSTVKFPNHDPIFHNVFSLSGTRTFDLGRYPRGDSKSVTFDQAGIVPVFCHIHSDMSAIILVLNTPYFTVPGTDRHYRLDGIPPGAYTLVAWHERAEPVQIPVEIADGQSLELNLTVPIEDEEPAQP